MSQSTEEKEEDRKNEYSEDVSKAEESNASSEGIEPDEDISTIVTGSRLALIFWQVSFSSSEANVIQLHLQQRFHDGFFSRGSRPDHIVHCATDYSIALQRRRRYLMDSKCLLSSTGEKLLLGHQSARL